MPYNGSESLLTFMQQVEGLKSWNKLQHQCLSSSNDIQNTEVDAPKVNVTVANGCEEIYEDKYINELDISKSKISPFNLDNNDYVEIGNSCSNDNIASETIQHRNRPKQKYLRKGEGLSRFRITSDFYKRKNLNKPVKTKLNNDKSMSNGRNDEVYVSDRNNDNEHRIKETTQFDKITEENFNTDADFVGPNLKEIVEDGYPNQKKIDDLKLFEMLEEKANNSSFSSTSSLIRKLMEESFKSTPIKTRNIAEPEPSLEMHPFLDNNEQLFTVPNTDADCEFSSKNFLEKIEEESSKLEVTTDEKSNNSMSNIYSVNNSNNVIASDYNEIFYSWDANSKPSSISSCNCSECSCIEESSHFVSTSLSIIAEETLNYSPRVKVPVQKRIQNDRYDYQFNRACPTTKNDKISAELVENMSDLTLLETNEDNAALKFLLRARLQELEQEIETFKLEASTLNKLRRTYDDEYRKFISEKDEFLETLREERQREIQSFTEEKKKFLKEKMIFDKCVKDTKNLPSKVERAEIAKLKSEIVNLKNEMNLKTSRWGAAQARIRTQMKQLEDHNKALKEEIEKLRKSCVPKKTNFHLKSKKKNDQDDGCYPGEKVNLTSNLNSIPDSGASSQNKHITHIVTSQTNTDDDVCNNYDKLFSDFFNFENEKEFLTNIENYSEDDQLSDLLREINNSAFDVSNRDNLKEIREKINQDGSKEIWYSNGNVKKISADGRVIKMIYYNGDVKEMSSNDNTVKYYHSQNRTWHTKFGDGLEITEFSDGQLEKRYKDGTIEIVYPNDMFCVISPTGEEKWTYSDGSIVINDKVNNEKIIMLPNKQKEIHTKNYKRREYPDGTVKIVYVDGLQETRYSNGRVRLKNKDGLLISDSEIK